MRHWKVALRSLWRRPVYSVTVVILLTLGIGVNTALFSVVNTVLLQPLPYPRPSELVTVMEASAAHSQKESLMAPVRIEEWSRLSRTFQAISGMYAENVTDTGMSQPERLDGRRVAPRYFDVYAMPALVGRTFTPDEEAAGGPLAAVISYGLWARRYGLDPRITSRRLVVEGKGYSIVGVMPRTFSSATIDVWLPAQVQPFLLQQRGARFYSGVGRMKPGVTPRQAQADLASVENGLAEIHPKTDKGWSALVNDLKEIRVADSRKPLELLFGAVALLLLITISNVASLVLAQLRERERELAIRASLGGTRAQVIAAVMREIAWMAVAGAVCGYALARVSMNLLAKFFTDTPRMAELSVDWRALAFALAASLIGAAAFGLIARRACHPRRKCGIADSGRAWRGRRAAVGAARADRRSGGAHHAAAGQRRPAAAQFLQFEPRGDGLRFLARPDLPCGRGAGARIAPCSDALQEQLIGSLQRLPGVEAAGMTSFLPASGATLRSNITLEGSAATDESGNMPAGFRWISPGYLQGLRCPSAGRKLVP